MAQVIFNDRSTSVCINGVHSTSCKLECGLPQGSIMGPLICFTMPIGRIIQRHSLRYHFYADDLQLNIDFDPSSNVSIESALSMLEVCISDIQVWMTCNYMKLNNDKTESFNKRRMPSVKVQVGSDIIELSETVRNLGLIFDSEMSMSNQVSALSRNVTFHLRNISRIRRYVDFETCHNVIRSLILPRLDNGNI